MKASSKRGLFLVREWRPSNRHAEQRAVHGTAKPVIKHPLSCGYRNYIPWSHSPLRCSSTLTPNPSHVSGTCSRRLTAWRETDDIFTEVHDKMLLLLGVKSINLMNIHGGREAHHLGQVLAHSTSSLSGSMRSFNDKQEEHRQASSILPKPSELRRCSRSPR